jgi:VCBS repeat-containing protein
MITWLDPWEGSALGGTIVKIAGANFAPNARVTFDGVPAQVRSAQSNSIEVSIPPHAAGSVAVKVENPGAVPLSDELPSHYDAETSPGVFVHVPIGFNFSSAIEPPPVVNTAPVAVNDSYATAQGTPLAVSAPGILANDTDVDGDALHVVEVTSTLNGTLVANADGSFTYTPNVGFSGVDGFTYKAHDGTDGSALASVTITVTPVNHPPVAVDDTATFVEEDAARSLDVLLNDTDADLDLLTAELVTGPAHGTLALNADGSFTYTPDPDFNGTDSFTYRANDGTAASAPATVTLTVAPRPDVTSVVVNGGAAQRSRVTTLDVTFDMEVDATLLATAFTLRRQSDSATVGTVTVATRVENGRTIATLTFAGANTESGSLADGRWTLFIDRTKVKSASGGLEMTADYTLSGIGRLFGDGTGDGRVDNSDFFLFRSTYGLDSSQAGFLAFFDYDGGGLIDNADFFQFRARFGLSI